MRPRRSFWLTFGSSLPRFCYLRDLVARTSENRVNKLYHFTSWHHLHGIGRFGLTVGDVPTDIHRWKGCCGVWLTSNGSARGHGLEGSSVDKSRYRLTVDVPEDDPALVKWTEWTSESEMRHPVFLGLRTDKKASAVVREQA